MDDTMMARVHVCMTEGNARRRRAAEPLPAPAAPVSAFAFHFKLACARPGVSHPPHDARLLPPSGRCRSPALPERFLCQESEHHGPQ